MIKKIEFCGPPPTTHTNIHYKTEYFGKISSVPSFSNVLDQAAVYI